MVNIKTTGLLLGAVLLVAITLPARAADRTLLTLVSAPTGTVKLEVTDVPGMKKAASTAAFPTWKVLPGDPIRADSQPPDRLVELYSGTLLAPDLLCRIVLHYYPSDDGWIPQFRLEEQPAVAWINGRWQPLGDIAGIVRHGNLVPNAEGFFQTIEFGLSAGSLAIIAWRVR